MAGITLTQAQAELDLPRNLRQAHGRQAPRIRKLARDGRWLPAFHAERPLEVMLAETYRLVSEGRVSLRQAQLLIYAMQITAACEKSRS
ncbi:MAG TPA: hypothetical protein VNK82_02905 [Terriglobales bacterium]|nr:hypothetical protein [Terriglobales bacterium]